MPSSISYDDYLFHSLSDPEEAAGYLNAALEDGDLDVFLMALRKVVQAQGGISELAEANAESRDLIARILAREEIPDLNNTRKILKSLGFSLTVNTSR
jgi:probable addiction module antidote protein